MGIVLCGSLNGKGQKKRCISYEKSKIQIPHNDAECPTYDDFGAYLYTSKERSRYGSIYYRHFFEQGDTNGISYRLKIHNNDELVALNGDFVQTLTQKEVLARFKDVKVDEKASFHMVARRNYTQMEPEWIETSAKLVTRDPVRNLGTKNRSQWEPEEKRLIPTTMAAPYMMEDSDGGPLSLVILDHQGNTHDVKNVKLNTSTGKWIEVAAVCKHRYNVPGTQHYLNISNGEVYFDTLNSEDRASVISRLAKYSNDDRDFEHILFEAALCDESMEWYIALRETVELERDPVWFAIGNTGIANLNPTYHFEFQGRYLGYERQETSSFVAREVKVQDFNEGFEEKPVLRCNTNTNLERI